MCGEAWKCIQHYAYALYHGADTPFGEGWMRKPGVAIATCNDGIRPVTFKLERIDHKYQALKYAANANCRQAVGAN